jgi:hypothetical protein
VIEKKKRKTKGLCAQQGGSQFLHCRSEVVRHASSILERKKSFTPKSTASFLVGRIDPPSFPPFHVVVNLTLQLKPVTKELYPQPFLLPFRFFFSGSITVSRSLFLLSVILFFFLRFGFFFFCSPPLP